MLLAGSAACWISDHRPSQAKVLTEGGELREALVDVSRLVAIPAFDRIAGLRDSYLRSNWGYAIANEVESG
jgi:hypothetical protein